MSNRTFGILGTLVLTIFLAAFTGSALAANGNGKANSDTAAAAPGNSGNAPGHNKDSASIDVSTSTQGSASQNAPTTNGMKPTNSTSKNTSCTTGGGGGSAATCAPSSSNTAAAQVGTKDSSKRYGNGQTAAQIATSNGAPAGSTIFGPGNSQPHKVAACPNAKSHMVDVHAVKHFNSAKCSTSSTTQTQVMTSVNGTTTVTGSTTVTSTAGTKSQGNGLALGRSKGGVLGVTATVGNAGNAAPTGGVLGALTTVGQGTLPFTGFPLWVAVALALMLMVLGLGLRHTARARV